MEPAPASSGEPVVSFRAAATLSRGLLPAILLGTALAGCRSDAVREAGGPDESAPAVAPAIGAGPVPVDTPAPNPATRAPAATAARNARPAVADAPASVTDSAAGVAPGPTLGATPPRGKAKAGAAGDGATEPTGGIVYHVVKGARFFDILVARIGNREHIVIGETDDMCLDLPDQRDFDGDGSRDALVFRSPRCRGDAAPGLLFFVFADTTFRLSNPFPGHRPRVERWNGEWSVVTDGARHVLRDGRAVRVGRVGSADPRGPVPGQSHR